VLLCFTSSRVPRPVQD